jgi:eukaryotic-like serine/threonine-protein kinase
MEHFRIFVSSPGDVDHERRRVDRVVQRLNGEFAGIARLEAIRWETEFYQAHATFQAQIPASTECDMVVAIFRGRLGTELPPEFERQPDGTPYPSGTAYEVLTAMAARRENPFPDIFVFRHTESPSVRLDDPAAAQVHDQWQRLKSFFDKWFVTEQGHFQAAFHNFQSTDDFEQQVERLLRHWLEEKVLHGRSVLWPIATKGLQQRPSLGT